MTLQHHAQDRGSCSASPRRTFPEVEGAAAKELQPQALAALHQLSASQPGVPTEYMCTPTPAAPPVQYTQPGSVVIRIRQEPDLAPSASPMTMQRKSAEPCASSEALPQIASRDSNRMDSGQCMHKPRLALKLAGQALANTPSAAPPGTGSSLRKFLDTPAVEEPAQGDNTLAASSGPVERPGAAVVATDYHQIHEKLKVWFRHARGTDASGSGMQPFPAAMPKTRPAAAVAAAAGNYEEASIGDVTSMHAGVHPHMHLAGSHLDNCALQDQEQDRPSSCPLVPMGMMPGHLRQPLGAGQGRTITSWAGMPSPCLRPEDIVPCLPLSIVPTLELAVSASRLAASDPPSPPSDDVSGPSVRHASLPGAAAQFAVAAAGTRMAPLSQLNLAPCTLPVHPVQPSRLARKATSTSMLMAEAEGTSNDPLVQGELVDNMSLQALVGSPKMLPRPLLGSSSPLS